MGPRLRAAAKTGVHGGLKLAKLLETPEEEVAASVESLEGDAAFERLRAAGAVRVEAFEGARFAERRFGGWGLRTATDGLPEALDAGSEPVRLIQELGEDKFREVFLGDDAMDDAARARACGLTPAQAKLLRVFVDRLYIQEELEGAPAAAPSKTFSAVAGVEIADGRPVLAFFNRPIWKGRYRVDAEKYARLKESLPPRERARCEALLKKLEFLDRRKSTLYRVLEEILREQAGYFLTGEPGKRRPLTQKAVADRADSSPSVVNRLIAGKSLQLPWGPEAPLKVFVPSAKTLLKDRLHDLAVLRPDAPDEELRRVLERETGARLSRRSVAQYRQDLGLRGRGQRH